MIRLQNQCDFPGCAHEAFHAGDHAPYFSFDRTLLRPTGPCLVGSCVRRATKVYIDHKGKHVHVCEGCSRDLDNQGLTHLGVREVAA